MRAGSFRAGSASAAGVGVGRLRAGVAALAALAAAVACNAPALAAGPANEFDCLIEPAQVVEVRSPIVGLIQEVHARRGDNIRQGQLLVTIESSVERSAAETARFRADTQGALQLSRNKLAASREKARRMAELFDEEFVSAQARDDAAAEAKLAEAELMTAQENAQVSKLEHRQSVDQLNRRVLRSPFNGVVMDQYLYPGALVDAGEGKKPILKIAQTQPLVVQAVLPYLLFPQVKPGRAVIVVPEKPFTREINASIRAVDRVIESASGTFGVVLNLPNAGNDLPGGIRCKLRLPGLQ